MQALDQWKSVFRDPDKKAYYSKEVIDKEKKLGAFLEFDPEKDTPGSNNENESSKPLKNIPYAVKDNIAVKGFHLTCGSKMLENLVSPYSATAVEKLGMAGARAVGKTNCDEFGMGSSTDNSALGRTSNPWDLSRVAGGSSGGSAAAVAAGMVPFALGSDTGGSVRQPASFCGIYGLKPTYGSVSRYGLVAYASSLEVIGILSRNIEILQLVYHTIAGFDPRDHSSREIQRTEKPSGKTIGILPDLQDTDPLVVEQYKKTAEIAEKAGYTVKPITLKILDIVIPVYYTIAAAEASANLARYNGIRYGLRPDYAENPEELVRKSRDAGFGDEVKLRILLGTYVLRSGFQDQYYLRAQKLRTVIRNELDKIFQEVDYILTPVFPALPFLHGEGGLTSFQQKTADLFTATANLAGIPALAIPGGMAEGLPVGMQLLAPAFQEDALLEAAEIFSPYLPCEKPPLYMDRRL